MLFWIIVAFIALQFTSGITEFIATNKAGDSVDLCGLLRHARREAGAFAHGHDARVEQRAAAAWKRSAGERVRDRSAGRRARLDPLFPEAAGTGRRGSTSRSCSPPACAGARHPDGARRW